MTALPSVPDLVFAQAAPSDPLSRLRMAGDTRATGHGVEVAAEPATDRWRVGAVDHDAGEHVDDWSEPFGASLLDV